jgi:hypothetical protein
MVHTVNEEEAMVRQTHKDSKVEKIGKEIFETLK